MNTLRQDLRHYLSMRRGLGFQLREAGRGLADFVAFLEERKARYITRELALAWAQQPQKVQSAEWARRLGFVRGFARYRSATDPCTEVPPQGLLPFRAKRARPYIYSDAEIRSLLRAALDMRYHFEGGKLRPWMFHCLFGLLSVAGLRIGEARNLRIPHQPIAPKLCSSKRQNINERPGISGLSSRTLSAPDIIREGT